MPVLVYKQKQLFHWQCGAPELNLALKSMADHVVVDDVHDNNMAVHDNLAVTNRHAHLKVGDEYTELNLAVENMEDYMAVDDVHDSDVAVHSDNDLAVTNLHAPLKVGNEHNFYEELEKAIKALEKVQNINFWIRDSRSIMAAKRCIKITIRPVLKVL